MASSNSSLTPRDVLTFWFGEAYYDEKTRLDSQEYMREMSKVWFFGSPDGDAEIRQDFGELIRSAGRNFAGKGPREISEWQETREGLMATLILTDQLARNAFRGTSEAFDYGPVADQVVDELVKRRDAFQMSPPEVAMILLAYMHSEDMERHADGTAFATNYLKETGGRGNDLIIRQLEKDLPEHTAVLAEFGHYPHRNDLMGRGTTPEEFKWLNSDQCPGWAKSQLTRK